MHEPVSEDVATIWLRVRGGLEASLPPSAFQLWVEPLRPLSVDSGVLCVAAPAPIRDWVERRYAGLLRDLARAAVPGLSEVRVVVADPRREASAEAATTVSHRFDDFVIGQANRFAHAAALHVAEMPGEAYNPLFLHGPPGVGKTHLLTAIDDYLRRRHPELVIRRTTAEQFTREFVTAVRTRRMDAFTGTYRELDVLLVDDVQFLEDKSQTGEEFFHVFNALRDAGAQIVISSDRPPRALSRLADRLRDRFEWGLCAELDPPDLGTRLVVLRRLAEPVSSEYDLSSESAVLREIAAHCSNLRQLEGALTRVLAFSSVMGSPPTLAVVRDLLGGAVQTPAQQADATAAADPIRQIQEAVCDVFHLSLADELLAKNRTPNVVRARQLAIYVCRQRLSLSLNVLARAFNRDKATILHSVRTVECDLSPGSASALALERVLHQLDAIATGPGGNLQGTDTSSPPPTSSVPPGTSPSKSRTIGGSR